MPPSGLLIRRIVTGDSGPGTPDHLQSPFVCRHRFGLPARALNKTASKMGSCYSLEHEFQRPEEHYLLSQLYAQRMCIFWHEGLADLTGFIPSKYLRMTHRQEMHWQVGFVLFGTKGDSE
jgi:hypothetical protein